MKNEKDLSIINCIATALLAYFFTVPVHELFHLLTYYAYGDKGQWFSAGAVQSMGLIDYHSLPIFQRILATGGSASILNAIIGILLCVILLKTRMRAMTRLFLTQLMGGHLSVGIGYFMIGGFFSAGDWGTVFSYLEDTPEVIITLRIVLSIVGGGGIVAVFFILNHMSYYFIENADDKSERVGVAFKLHLLMLIVGYPVGMIVTVLSPAVESGELNIALGLLYNMMWIPFFWGFMFTGVMHTLPPKKSRFLYKLPGKPQWSLLAVGMILILIDIIVFGPGIQLN